jgi:hypothetical protein
MDADLIQKLAPRRNKRHAGIRAFNEEAEWADALDWKNNDYDFYRLFHSILDRLDVQYREECGLRLGQLAAPDELLDFARTDSAHYQREENRYQILGIYSYLIVSIRIHLAGKLRQLLDKRHQGRSTTR